MDKYSISTFIAGLILFFVALWAGVYENNSGHPVSFPIVEGLALGLFFITIALAQRQRDAERKIFVLEQQIEILKLASPKSSSDSKGA